MPEVGRRQGQCCVSESILDLNELKKKQKTSLWANEFVKEWVKRKLNRITQKPSQDLSFQGVGVGGGSWVWRGECGGG